MPGGINMKSTPCPVTAPGPPGAGRLHLDASRATSSSPRGPPGTSRASRGLPALAGAGRLLDARPNHFVQSEGATGDEPCQPGTYQPSGAVRLPRCEAGHFVQSEGPPGTSRASRGPTSPLRGSPTASMLLRLLRKNRREYITNYSRSRLLLLRIEHDRSRDVPMGRPL